MKEVDGLVSNSLFTRAYYCLLIKNPVEKVSQTLLLQQLWSDRKLNLDTTALIEKLVVPGRPEKPVLVSPKQVPGRNFTTPAGRLNLVHAITHIEFNAINLALDAVYRFQDMPDDYYTDWCRIAAEEAEHFTFLSTYLNDHGMQYGDLVAHNGLWEMAVKTDTDVLIRMALVPRVLEARGLDVTPRMIRKLQALPDYDQSEKELVQILQRIYKEEIGHVKAGTRWFNYLCKKRGLEPDRMFSSLLDDYMQGAKFGPFDSETRQQAGFSAQEMHDLLHRI